jgi:hypothetical protein
MPYLFLFFRFISIVSMKESLIPLKINTIYFSTTISLSRWWTATGLVDLPVSSCLVMHMQVYHPNIDLEGNVCLNILREDWNPVLSVNSILYGLQYLFLDPNPDDPLNHEAAEVLRDNPRQFDINVKRSMAGGYVAGNHFPRCI